MLSLVYSGLGAKRMPPLKNFLCVGYFISCMFATVRSRHHVWPGEDVRKKTSVFYLALKPDSGLKKIL